MQIESASDDADAEVKGDFLMWPIADSWPEPLPRDTLTER